MEYYKLLQLHREPFSNSPDPEYFFNSRQHMGCLQKVELALRLKRGLNVIIGDVGTGKTTLCRQLIRKFSTEPDIETHLILDPSFESSTEFLKRVLGMFCSIDTTDDLSQTEMKEMIKGALFKMGVDEGKTIILIIDEGQKISDPCLEILRELLNYETNTFKLLQIVIFAQLEFNAILEAHANFADRINLHHHLEPLSFTDTRQLIQHRLKLSSTTAKPMAVFTLPALWAIYRASRGYPRKIIHLCHQSILALIIQNQTKAGWALIQSCKKRIGASVPSKRNMVVMTSLALLLAIFGVVFFPALKSRQGAQSKPSLHKVAVTQSIPAAITETPQVFAPQSGGVETPPSSAPETTTMVETDPEAAPQAAGIETPHETELTAAVKHPPDNMAPNLSADNVPETIDTPMTRISGVVDEPASPEPQASPPDIIGRLIVQPGDTISAMTTLVYGTPQNRSLKSVIEANSHIDDPNAIHIGDIIAFPLQTFKATVPETPFFMVVLDETQTLVAAIQRLQTLSSRLEPSPTLVSNWTPVQGLRFQLIQMQYFSTQKSARIYIEQLPSDIATQAVILTGWPDETIFSSNPFINLEQHFD